MISITDNGPPLRRQVHAQQAQIAEQQAALTVQGKNSQRQQAQIARLSSQIMAIQAALKTNLEADTEVRTVMAKRDGSAPVTQRKDGVTRLRSGDSLPGSFSDS